MAVALQRIEVLGLSYLGLGMYCTMFLVDFAADVWRVERPNHAVGAKGANDSACSLERGWMWVSVPSTAIRRA